MVAQPNTSNTTDRNWSTAKVDAILKAYNLTGSMPITNPFFMRHVKKRKANLHFTYTKQEFLEYAKIRKNILYYGEKYCVCLTDDGLVKIKFRPYQKKVLYTFLKNKRVIYLASRQVGKCVTLNTKVDVIIDGVQMQIPMYELYYNSLPNPGFLDKLQYFLSKLVAKLS